MDAGVLDTLPASRGDLPTRSVRNLGATRYRLVLRAATPVRPGAGCWSRRRAPAFSVSVSGSESVSRPASSITVLFFMGCV